MDYITWHKTKIRDFSMKVNSYMKQWVSGMTIIHLGKYLEEEEIDYL